MKRRIQRIYDLLSSRCLARDIAKTTLVRSPSGLITCSLALGPLALLGDRRRRLRLLLHRLLLRRLPPGLARTAGLHGTAATAATTAITIAVTATATATLVAVLAVLAVLGLLAPLVLALLALVAVLDVLVLLAPLASCNSIAAAALELAAAAAAAAAAAVAAAATATATAAAGATTAAAGSGPASGAAAEALDSSSVMVTCSSAWVAWAADIRYRFSLNSKPQEPPFRGAPFLYKISYPGYKSSTTV